MSLRYIVPLVLLTWISATAAFGGPTKQEPWVHIDSPTTSRVTPRIQLKSIYQPVPAETTFFGGTYWNADSTRWEAILDSCWTFDTGVGSHFDHGAPYVDPFKDPGLHASMEGWIGIDKSAGVSNPFFRRLGEADFAGCTVCVGDATGTLGGDYSFYAGVLCGEADSLCYAAGQGYGSDWNVAIEKTFTYTGGDLTLRFDYVNETESGFDFTRVFADSSNSGEEILVTSYTGSLSGADSLSLVQGVHLPVQTPATVTLRFRVRSDETYDDGDGLFATACGAFAVDNILLTQADAPGSILFGPDTFELGADGWALSPTLVPGPGGDWSDIVHVDDLPPPLVSVPVSDTVLVFIDLINPSHGPFQDNLAISPWIDLKRHVLTGFPKVIAADHYADGPLLNYIFGQTQAQWYPDTCGVTGSVRVSPFTSTGFVHLFGQDPVGGRGVYDFSEIINPDAEQVRIAIGVISLCRFFAGCTEVTNSTPWFDNIQFGVVTTPEITIQGAIDLAAPGDTVLVSPGTYTGLGNRDLDFKGKNICLLAPAGPDSTVIDCEGLGRGFIFQSGEDSTAVVEGFTITNGVGEVDSSYTTSLALGGCIYVTQGSSPTFLDCHITNGSAVGGVGGGLGGGVAVSGAAFPTFRDCLITNSVATDGGGVYAFGSGTRATLVASEITGNEGAVGGVRLSAGLVDSCTVSGNTGAGIQLGNAVVSNSTISGNAGDGVSGFSTQFSCGSGLVLNCIILDNTGTGAACTTLDDCLISGNGAGGVVLDGTSIKNSVITGNNSAGAGGGVLLAGTSFAEDCIISGNSAKTGGGVMGQPSFSGNAPRLTRCVITGNRATETGGGIGSQFEPSTVVENCTISGNRAAIGGGAYVQPLSTLNSSKSIFWGNCADSLGAELFLDDSTSAAVFTCSAVDTSGIEGMGAVTYSGSQVFVDPRFCNPEPCTSAPTAAGDHTLQANSPCLPASSPCAALIGALGEGCATVGVGDPFLPPLPTKPALAAYPNPFTGSLSVDYVLPSGGAAALEIYDISGRLVRRFEIESTPGRLRWDGLSDAGKRVPAGIYLLRLVSGAGSPSRRVVLLN